MKTASREKNRECEFLFQDFHVNFLHPRAEGFVDIYTTKFIGIELEMGEIDDALWKTLVLQLTSIQSTVHCLSWSATQLN